jgi:hypothetical protein
MIARARIVNRNQSPGVIQGELKKNYAQVKCHAGGDELNKSECGT